MPDQNTTPEHTGLVRARIVRSIAFIVILLSVGVLTVIIARDIAKLVSGAPTISRPGRLLRLRGTGMELRASDIQPWMTFDYVARIFRLDPADLQQRLGITDVRYPRVSINRYAREINVDSGTALRRIQDAVSALTTSTAR